MGRLTTIGRSSWRRHASGPQDGKGLRRSAACAPSSATLGRISKSNAYSSRELQASLLRLCYGGSVEALLRLFKRLLFP